MLEFERRERLRINLVDQTNFHIRGHETVPRREAW
jgi:hypothetical protein